MMKVSALSMAALVGASKFSGERNLDSYTYDMYKTEFSKAYTATEHSHRQENFETNMKHIQNQNANPEKSWFATVNKFTDMTNEEFRKVYHGHSPHPAGTFAQADLSSHRQDLPASVDWRDVEGVVTPVKDQGSCGSCWAFSATESMESAYALQNNVTAPILSPQQYVSCAPNPHKCGGAGGCDGSTQPLAFEYSMGIGLTTEESYPYKGKTGKCEPENIKPVVINYGFTQLKVNNYTELVTAIANVGPVSISVAAGGLGWQTYGGGVYDKGDDFVMDHAVQVVGYGEEDGKMYWTVRNSWGPKWGEHGFMKIQRFGEGAEPCGMDNNPADGDACEGDRRPREYCGLCGILSSSSFPTGVMKV